MSIWAALGITLGVLAVYMTAGWLLSLARKDASVVDPLWGAGFVVAAVSYLLLLDGYWSPRGARAGDGGRVGAAPERLPSVAQPGQGRRPALHGHAQQAARQLLVVQLPAGVPAAGPVALARGRSDRGSDGRATR